MSSKNKATASLVCGILSIALFWAGYGALVGIILGVAAVVLSISAKKEGFTGGMQTAGMVLGVIGIVICGLCFVSCIICTGCFAALGAAAQ